MSTITERHLCLALDEVKWESSESVQSLESQVIEFRHETNQAGFHGKLIPITLFLKALKELASESRQFLDDEKKALARVVSLVAEQIFFICEYQSRRIYKQTYDECIGTLDKVASTLKTRDVATSYWVEYAKAAVLSLECGEGTMKELGSRHVKSLLVGVLKLSPKAAIEPLVDTGQDFLEQFQDGLYVNVFPIRYIFSQAKDEQGLRNDKIQKNVEGWIKNERQALAVAEGVINISLTTKDKKLREKLISEGIDKIPPLHILAQNSHWKVRHFVLDYLLSLDLDKFRISESKSLPEFLAERMSAETSSREISWLFFQALKKLLGEGKTSLPVKADTMTQRRVALEVKSKENNKKYKELKAAAQEIEKSLKESEAVSESIPQSASGDVYTQDKPKKPKGDPLDTLSPEKRKIWESWSSLPTESELEEDIEQMELLLEIETLEKADPKAPKT